MNCRDAKPQLELLALGELNDADRRAVEAHLADCPACARAAAETRSLVGRLASPRPAPASAGLLLRVQQATQAEIAAAGRRRGRRRRMLAAATLAAGLALMVTGWQLLDRPAAREAAPLARSTPTPIQPTPALQPTLQTLWEQPASPSAPVSAAHAVVLHGSRIYLLQQDLADGHVSALDAATGRSQWTSQACSLGYLSADDQNVYCLSAGSRGRVELVALDAATGRPRWRYDQGHADRLHSPCAATPLPGGRVCWSTNDRVHVIDAATGQAVWSRDMGGQSLVSAGQFDDGNLYVASAGSLFCLSPETGQTRWQVELDDAVSRMSRPMLAVVGGRVVAALATRDGRSRVVCLDPPTCRPLWARSTERVFHLTSGDGRLYVRHQQVQALDPASGQAVWTRQAKGCAPVTCADGLVYFVDASDSGTLLALDGRTGQQRWQSPGLQSCEPFVTLGERGYLKTRDGVLHAVALGS